MATVVTTPTNERYERSGVTAPRSNTSVATNIPMFRRISWGAVLAGVVVALVVQLTLNALGLSFGAATIEPFTNDGPSVPEFGVSMIVWMAASALLSLGAGGYVAGRMAGTVNNQEGLIHGLTTWAVVVLITIYLVTSGVGSVIGGVVNILGQGIQLAGQGAAAIAPEVAEALELQEISLQSIQEEVRDLVMTANAEPVTSEEGSAATNSSAAITNGDGEPTAAERQANLALAQLFRLGLDADDATRQEVISTIATTTGLTPEEATERVAAWEQQIDTARVRAEQIAEDVGGDFADTVARVAGLVFLMMLLGAFAAGMGGIIGSPDVDDVVEKAEQAAVDAAATNHAS